MTAEERSARTRAADELCAGAWVAALGDRDDTGLALVAVGGYGRRQLAPFSDLDVVLLHREGIDVAPVAEKLWYPLWDAGAPIDHSVRALEEVADAATGDVRVALGLLDARHLAGDASVSSQMRRDLLARWRRDARTRLPELQQAARRRAERYGELAHVAMPDLKDSSGGLRDAAVLAAVVATWLVDVPHGDLERCRTGLLDVRDALHGVTGRANDRIAPEIWPELAEALGWLNAEEAQQRVRVIGRRLSHISRLTWRRVDGVLASPRAGPRRPRLHRLGNGLAVSHGEVVLEDAAPAVKDPLLLLRAGAEASERNLILSPVTSAGLGRAGVVPSEPWGREARDLLTRMLAGPGLLPVWETLDETGALEALLPELAAVRLLPHVTPVHRFTVDRHLVETCVEASRLIRRVARPDLLLVAALLHDIGKGGAGDHSAGGAPLARVAAERMGFPPEDASVIAKLVRWHLLLVETATSRDLDDPQTIAHVAERVTDVDDLDLLLVLTEADARATSAKAWSPWRAGLVQELVRRVRGELRSSGRRPPAVEEEAEIPQAVVKEPAVVHLELVRAPYGSTLRAISGDRIGLMAAIAGTLAVQRVRVHAVRSWQQEEYALSLWDLADPPPDVRVLRQLLDSVLAGRADVRSLLRSDAGAPSNLQVMVRHEVSLTASVLEIHGDDRLGVLHRICSTLADLEISVRSAHVTTLGPQAVDVFYLQEPGAGALAEERAASAAHAVRSALENPVTLDL